MERIGQQKRRIGTVRSFLLILAVAVALAASVFHLIIANTKYVAINDEGIVTEVKTLKTTVAQLLQENSIVLHEGDEIQPLPETQLQKEQELIIQRAVPVTIAVDGEERSLKTCKDTVAQVLQQANVQIHAKDIMNYEMSDAIVADMEIVITRVTEMKDIITEKIPFETIERANEKMDRGKTRIVQQGVEGEKQKQYAVVLHDGKEVSRQLVSEEIVKQPVNQVKEYGTVAVYKTSRGETFRYKKILNMRATAYDLSYESCGKEPDHPQYGITYTGMKAKHGVVAVDPNTIPLYSRLYIEAADGSWSYGYAVAGDIGGAVKGNIIDLFYADEEFVKKFGVKKVKVYILE